MALVQTSQRLRRVVEEKPENNVPANARVLYGDHEPAPLLRLLERLPDQPFVELFGPLRPSANRNRMMQAIAPAESVNR